MTFKPIPEKNMIVLKFRQTAQFLSWEQPPRSGEKRVGKKTSLILGKTYWFIRLREQEHTLFM